MVESANILIQTENLLESNMVGTLIISYVFLILILFVSFLNIFSVDKYEFLHNKQSCFEVKHKLPFIFMYSKDKRFISKKTFFFEILGYLILISLTSIAIFSILLNLEVKLAFILLGIYSITVVIFGFITGYMYRTTKNK
jgi:hypothetical protein